MYYIRLLLYLQRITKYEIQSIFEGWSSGRSTMLPHYIPQEKNIVGYGRGHFVDGE